MRTFAGRYKLSALYRCPIYRYCFMSLTCISSLLSTWKVQWNLPRADIFNSGHISKADSKSGTVTSQTLINLRLQSGHLSKAGTIFGPVSVRFKDVSLYMLLQRLLIRTTDVPCVQLYNTTHTGCQSHYLLWCQLHRQRRMIFCGWCQSGQIRQMFDTWHFCVLKWVLIFCKKNGKDIHADLIAPCNLPIKFLHWSYHL